MSPPLPHGAQPACPHEDRIGALVVGQAGLESKLDENTKKTDRACAATERILDLLQGEDPLTKPGQGLVSKVDSLYREKKERDDLAATVRKAAWGGASAGGLALASVLWSWMKEWVKDHWNN